MIGRWIGLTLVLLASLVGIEALASWASWKITR